MANLEALNLKDLRAVARDVGVKGWWNMKKTELLEAIDKADVKVINQNDPEVVEAEPDVSTKVEEENVPEDAPAPKKKNQKRLIEYNGKTQTLTAWAKELGIRHQTLYNRIVMKGWEVDRAFETPIKKEVKVNAEASETK